MASGPLKSQPLHNFSLPHLKWGKNQMNNHRCRKPSSSPPGDDHHHHHHHHRSSYSSSSSSSFASEPESDSVVVGDVVTVTSPSYIGSKKKPFGFSSSASPPPQQQQQQTQPLKKQHTTNNLFIRFRKSSSSNKGYESSSKKPHKSGGGGYESSSAVNKPWNLRPRKTLLKPKPKPFNEIGGGGGGGREDTHSPNKKNPKPTEVEERPAAENYPPPKSLRLRGFAEAAAAHNVVEKKRKFSVSLSRDEIEEDFFVLTGFKPPRRPKKRAKNIQKQLENLFPGLWLTEITAESYSVPEVPLKR